MGATRSKVQPPTSGSCRGSAGTAPCYPLEAGVEGVIGQIAEQLVPRMIWPFLHVAYDSAHFVQHGGIIRVVQITLQELEHVDAVLRILNESREKHVQAVIHGDEVVPVL